MMILKVKKAIKVIFNIKMFKMLISMNTSGYLKEIGWINSFNALMPMDRNSNPLPWVTYGFIDFITDRLKPNMDVFEYGSGNSTLWYAMKVNSVASVEHDLNWFNSIKSKIPVNARINYQELIYGEDYSSYVKNFENKFDIIIVDGRDRVNCIRHAIASLKDDGILVLDDSERAEYIKGVDFLLNHNFKKIDFWGISPGLFYRKNTTIFYKNNNCLGI